MGIAITLIVLMAITATLSMISVFRVSDRLDKLTHAYVPAYGELARANIRSLERGLALRRMIIARMQGATHDAEYAAHRATFEAKGAMFEQEVTAADTLIKDLINKSASVADARALTRLESHLDAAVNETRRHLNEEIARMLRVIDAGDIKAIDEGLARVDALRDELNQKLDTLRAEMLGLLSAEAALTTRRQHQIAVIAGALTLLAAGVGLVFSMLVSAGMTRPVRKLLEGAQAVEAGRLDQTLAVTTRDEIGRLTSAFNLMVEQLRLKERIRATFGKYIDPRIVEGLIEGSGLGAEGQRRVMTVMFCDVKGFTSTSEGMTPQGLVKVMNCYFSTMSAPIREQKGIIDKYIGDAIMAYWGAPFTEHSEQSRLAGLAALEMLARVPQLREAIPELLGVRSLAQTFDLRIGIATGEVLVGSIGSEQMMSYTVMGDTVNLASRLEGANKEYGSRILVSEATAGGVADILETREIDRLVTVGQSRAQSVFEIMGRKGKLTAAQIELRSRFAEGLAAYRAKRWDEARRAFEAALKAVADDGPAKTFLSRIEVFATTPPPDDWDGAWHLERK